MTTAVAFDPAPVFDYRASLDALDEIAAEVGFLGEFRVRRWPVTPEDLAEDAEWWGEHRDPGGDPIRPLQVAGGAALVLAGRLVPLIYAADDIARVGIVGRMGQCGAWAQAAVARILAEHGDTAQGITMCFGRCFGEGVQTWVEFFDGGGWQVYDLTISEEPWSRTEYVRALHAVACTRLPIPNLATLEALYEAIEDGAWEYGRRAETLSPQALAHRQQKE